MGIEAGVARGQAPTVRSDPCSELEADRKREDAASAPQRFGESLGDISWLLWACGLCRKDGSGWVSS